MALWRKEHVADGVALTRWFCSALVLIRLVNVFIVRAFGWLVLLARSDTPKTRRSWCCGMRSRCCAVMSPVRGRAGLAVIAALAGVLQRHYGRIGS